MRKKGVCWCKTKGQHTHSRAVGLPPFSCIPFILFFPSAQSFDRKMPVKTSSQTSIFIRFVFYFSLCYLSFLLY